MKFSKLLVLSVLSLFGLGAQAVIVDGVRQRPVPAQAQEFQIDQTFYLYNVKGHRFFLGANDYNTRASIGSNGYRVKFLSSVDAPEGTVEFTDSVETQKTWKSTFSTADGNAIWVDNSGETYRFWKVEAVGNAYRLSNPVRENAFLGWNGDETDTRLYLLAPDAANAGIDWWFVAEADYQTCVAEWKAMEKQFNKAAELKEQIDIAVSLGLDVTAERGLYENEAATVDELEAAISPLKERIFNFRVQNASYENPADLSTLIKNPNGDDGNKEWLGNAPSMEYTVFEIYNSTFTTYQNLENVPNGIYDVTLHAFHRAGSTTESYASWEGSEPTKAFLYAKAGEDSVSVNLPHIFAGAAPAKLGVGSELGPDGSSTDGQTMYVPNNRQAAQKYFQRENDPYLVSVPVLVEDGKLRIGVYKKENKNMDWTPWDTWGLQYYGTSAAACNAYLNNFRTALPSFGDLTAEDIYTLGYMTAFTDMLAETINVANFEEAVAKKNAWSSIYNDLEKNLALWKEFQNIVTEADAVAANDALDPDYTSDLGDWSYYYAEEILTKHELTNDSLANLIAQKKAEIEEAKKHPISETDATNLLTNPAFDDARGATYGWTGFKSAYQIKWGNGKTSFQMPTDGGTATNKCAEAFSTTDFDLYQVVENAPVGVYEISVQGFCRNGRGDNAWNNYQNQTTYSQPGKFPVYVYLNDAQTPFVNVFSEPQEEGYYKNVNSSSEVYVKDGMEFPDGMVSSAVAFSAGMYTQKAYGLVAKEGDAMRIGVKGTSAGLDGEDDNWVIFDNFKLTWKGFQADIIKPVLEEQIAKAENETVHLAMDNALYARLVTAIADGKASITEGKGKVMFECLSALYEIDAKVNASKLVFAELEKANTNLANEIEVATEAGRTSALSDASYLNEQITTGIANHTIPEDAVNYHIILINSMISRLRMPDQDKIDNASDANPVDMTSLIQNATYDEGVSGWAGTEAAWGGDQGAIAELFNKNFNYYQEFSGLPAGTYEVSVQAFYRSGSAANDYSTLDSINTSHAFLYAAAINGTDSVMNAKAIQRLASITKNEVYVGEGFVGSIEESMEGYAVAHTDTLNKGTDSESYLRTFVPNTMSTANDQFMNSYFADNKVVVTLAEGETLRIGLLKTTLLENDWTIFDNWTLTYFGKNSAKSATGDNVTAIRTLDNQGETVKVEFFTLDGRKAGAAQKGLIIMKQTLDNGSIIVKKIRK